MIIQVFSFVGAMLILFSFFMLELEVWVFNSWKYLTTVIFASTLLLVAAALLKNYGFTVLNGAYILISFGKLLTLRSR